MDRVLCSLQSLISSFIRTKSSYTSNTRNANWFTCLSKIEYFHRILSFTLLLTWS